MYVNSLKKHLDWGRPKSNTSCMKQLTVLTTMLYILFPGFEYKSCVNINVQGDDYLFRIRKHNIYIESRSCSKYFSLHFQVVFSRLLIHFQYYIDLTLTKRAVLFTFVNRYLDLGILSAISFVFQRFLSIFL